MPIFEFLLYHEIGLKPRNSANLDCFCSLHTFCEQMRFLKAAGIHVILANDLYELLLHDDPPTETTVALTFDDGDVSFLRYAFPILEELGFPSTVFVVAGQLGGHAKWTRDPRNSIPLMTAAQIRTLPASMVEIGSHSMTHQKLATLSPEEAFCELRDSKYLLQDLLGRTVTSFAYPHGSYNPHTVELVHEAGYRYAYTTDGSLCADGKTDRFTIPRKYITYSEKLSNFACRLGIQAN